MTNQAKALRVAGQFLRMQWLGAPTSREESKAVSDLCFVSLPMKYRLTKAEIAAMEEQAANASLFIQLQ